MFPEFCAAVQLQGLERSGVVHRYCLHLNKFVPYGTILSFLKKTYSKNNLVVGSGQSGVFLYLEKKPCISETFK